MASLNYHLFRGLRWIAVGVWAWSKRFPLLHLLLFAAALVVGVYLAWIVPRENPDHATAVRVGGGILGIACIVILIRSSIALARGRWVDYCDQATERARAFYNPEQFR